MTGGIFDKTEQDRYIATLMLYQQLAGWDQYYVMSDNFVSNWNCRKNELTTITRKVWDRIYEGHDKGKKASGKNKK